jgi:tetratricopeptide (TPR) repeat protein
MMNTSKVVQCNNSGALYMLNGNYDQAVALFRNAVKLTKELLNHSRRLNIQRPTHGPELLFEFQDAGRSPQLISQDRNALSSAESFVSRGVVLISQNDLLDISVLNLYKISMITIYNLALANHLSGLQDRNMKSLKRALEYYEVSYKLHLQEPLSLKPTHALSIVNNVGAIYRLLHEHEKSNMFFSHLLSKMSVLKDSGHVEESVDRWNGFWSNIIGLVAHI